MQILSGGIEARAGHMETINPDTPEAVDLFDLLIKVFFLNKEERFRAGIYIGYEGREWVNRAALVIPPFDEEQNSH